MVGAIALVQQLLELALVENQHHLLLIQIQILLLQPLLVVAVAVADVKLSAKSWQKWVSLTV
jgi:hypothetical protein